MSRLSLTARLTLLFAAGSSVVLLGLGWLIGVSIEHHFEQQDRDTLRGKLTLARHVIERIDTPEAYERLPAQLRDAFVGHHGLVIQVLDHQGEFLLASPGVVFPADGIGRAMNAPGPHSFAWTDNGRHYRGVAEAMPTADAAWSSVVVAVATDAADHDAFMAGFLRTLWLFVAVAALTTGLLGWSAARHGLAPLRSMRTRAAAVTAQSLDQRLPVDTVPPEMATLATALNDMLGRLEEAFRRLSDFSSDLAHELRTPISNLLMQTQVALSRERDAAAYREILESNAEEFERLARMIGDMLFLAKAEHGLAMAHRETVDLAREVRGLFDFYEALADEREVRLRLVGAGSVRGDRLMLRRALSNLLSNALRYTPRDECVTVTLAADDAAVVVTVENPGATIPPQQLPRLFDRFYRTDPARHHVEGDGTGLGLAITWAIVQAHRGTIRVTSEAERTYFSVWLPMSELEIL